jgi:hypothetical protein
MSLALLGLAGSVTAVLAVVGAASAYGRPPGQLAVPALPHHAASHGTLKRWTTYRDPRGRLSYIDSTIVAKNVPGLRTLSFIFRKKVDGAVSDVLWGTTKTGKLQQMRIPVDHPENAKVVTVRKHGFDTVNAVSLSYCNDHPSTLSMIAISGSANSARWFTLRDQFQPRSRNLTNHGPAGQGANWHLHSTF